MLKEINLDNLDLISSSFIVVEEIRNELENNPFAKILIYVKDSITVGYLYYSDIYDRIEINQIEVMKEYRREGIAGKMLNFLVEKNKSITLEVKEDNVAAIKLYEKFGFKKVAIRNNYYGKVDGLLMERK